MVQVNPVPVAVAAAWAAPRYVPATNRAHFAATPIHGHRRLVLRPQAESPAPLPSRRTNDADHPFRDRENARRDCLEASARGLGEDLVNFLKAQGG